MIPQINVLLAVNVIGAFRTGSLAGNAYLMDNSQNNETTGQGTLALSSAVVKGQVINWHIIPIDLQTFAEIKNIVFYDTLGNELVASSGIPCAKLKKYGAPSGDYWAGMVSLDIPSGLYAYRFEVDMGQRVMMTEATPSILVR